MWPKLFISLVFSRTPGCHSLLFLGFVGMILRFGDNNGVVFLMEKGYVPINTNVTQSNEQCVRMCGIPLFQFSV